MVSTSAFYLCVWRLILATTIIDMRFSDHNFAAAACEKRRVLFNTARAFFGGPTNKGANKRAVFRLKSSSTENSWKLIEVSSKNKLTLEPHITYPVCFWRFLSGSGELDKKSLSSSKSCKKTHVKRGGQRTMLIQILVLTSTFEGAKPPVLGVEWIRATAPAGFLISADLSKLCSKLDASSCT